MSAAAERLTSVAGTAGGGVGVLIALALIVALVLAGFWLDRRLEPWVRRLRRSPLRPLRVLARRTVLLRFGMWLSVAALSLVIAAWLSALVAWILGPALALALAWAFAAPLRDIALGVGASLTGELSEGDYIAVAELEGEVTRVGLRGIELRTLDGTRVGISHGRIAREGLRRLTIESGGYPVDMSLPLAEDLDVAALMEGARLAASLAPHAHLGARPAVTLSEAMPPTLRVRGYAIDPFSAGPYRGEVIMSYREAVAELRGEPPRPASR